MAIVDQQRYQRLVLIVKAYSHHTANWMRKDVFIAFIKNLPQLFGVYLEFSVAEVACLELPGQCICSDVELTVVGYGMQGLHINQFFE